MQRWLKSFLLALVLMWCATFWMFAVFLMAFLFDFDLRDYYVSRSAMPAWTSIPYTLWYAFQEEAAYRAFPLIIALERGWSKKKVFVLVIVFSAIFALVHFRGLPALFLEGAFGIGLSVLFLICGGWQKDYLQAIFAATACHALYNLRIYYPNTILLFSMIVGVVVLIGFAVVLCRKKPDLPDS